MLAPVTLLRLCLSRRRTDQTVFHHPGVERAFLAQTPGDATQAEAALHALEMFSGACH